MVLLLLLLLLPTAVCHVMPLLTEHWPLVSEWLPVARAPQQMLAQPQQQQQKKKQKQGHVQEI
jgi:hypothetical protein